VTDACPADHGWHLGLSVALQDVGGWNFWGGPTYVRGQGYVWRDDHGRIEHEAFEELDGSGFAERLRWVTPSGELPLTERRHLRVRPADVGWELEMTTTLTNAGDRDIAVGSPATNGREGAGYGGLFCRLAPSEEPWVRTESAVGEAAGHGSTAPWLSWTDPARDFTLVFTRTGGLATTDPWFVRVADYPGVGLQLAARQPLTLSVGAGVTRGMRVLLADGVLADRSVLHWAGTVRQGADGDSGSEE
jgi:hypothetical protein